MVGGPLVAHLSCLPDKLTASNIGTMRMAVVWHFLEIQKRSGGEGGPAVQSRKAGSGSSRPPGWLDSFWHKAWYHIQTYSIHRCEHLLYVFHNDLVPMLVSLLLFVDEGSTVLGEVS